METDTIRIIADSINQSRAKLSEAVVEVKGEDRGVIFVKVDNAMVSPH